MSLQGGDEFELKVQSPGHKPEATPDRFKGSINHPCRLKEGDGHPYGSINHPERHINYNAPTSYHHQRNQIIFTETSQIIFALV